MILIMSFLLDQMSFGLFVFLLSSAEFIIGVWQ